MDIEKLIRLYMEGGYKNEDANVRVCQDIILSKIAKTNISRNVTIKGGVVMMALSHDSRRATRDLDLDFIKYSLSDSAVTDFVYRLSNVNDGVSIKISRTLEELRHQDYKGKRVFVELSDTFNNRFEVKLDIGVHKNLEIKQDEFYFDLNILNDNVNLFINSKEQIFVEKLKSLLKYGFTSTRYKDILDFYYLINMTSLDKSRLLQYFVIYIFDVKEIEENSVSDIYNRLRVILNNRRFIENVNQPKNNWLELPVDEVIKDILSFFEILEDDVVLDINSWK